MSVNKDDTVYHYCSIDSFLSIIQNSKIWLSDVRKLNDRSECSWIRDKVNSKIQRYLAELDATALDAWNMGYKMGADDESDQLTVYTTSFSECYDSLSQWRSYAQDGQGLAIGFSKTHLKVLGNKYPNRIIFNKVIYDEEKQAEFVDTIVKENIDKLQYKAVAHCGLELSTNYLIKFPLYKNPSFHEENEWRIIFPSGTGNKGETNIQGFKFLNNTKFRSTNGMIVPYLEMDFSNIKHDIIREIYIGPKSNVSRSDILNVLRESGYYDKEEVYSYNEPIRIIHSKSSYR